MSKKKKTKPNNLPAAMIVATATQPPPKPKEILAALVERERVRLVAIQKARETALENAEKRTKTLASMFAESLIPADLDTLMAATYGPRTKTVPDLEIGTYHGSHHSDPTRSTYYITLCYGSGGAANRALLKTPPVLADNHSPEGKRWAEACKAEAAARAERDACRVPQSYSYRGSKTGGEQWIDARLAEFKAKATGKLTLAQPAERVRARCSRTLRRWPRSTACATRSIPRSRQSR